MGRSVLFIIVVLFLKLSMVSAQDQKVKMACIAFYNIENLFDTINDPSINDEEFLPDGPKRWNSEKYYLKLNNIAKVISLIGDDYGIGGPVVIGLSEIENTGVLQDLVNTDILKPFNYAIIHVDGPDRRGVDVALLYRKDYFAVTNFVSARLVVEGNDNFRTRDQLVVSGILDGDPMHFIVNHWPSRSGGEKRSAPLRLAAAGLTKHLSDSLHNAFPNAKVIIMGDLNDNPNDASIMKVLKTKTDTLNMVYTDLYNPYYRMYKKLGIGSNAYRDSWSLFDQIIVSQPLATGKKGYHIYAAKIFNRPFLLQKEGAFKGYPLRTFVGNNFMGGYSDHFPAYIFLVR
jgi:hypothetical protein